MKQKYIIPIILVGLISLCIVAVLTLGCGYSGASIKAINDREYYPAVKRAFSEAEDSIHIALYGAKYYAGDSRKDNTQVNSLIDSLAEAVERGVKVKVLFDEEWEGVVETAIHLKSLGIDAKFDSEDVRTHAKFIVIDGELVIIGSTNWSYHALQKNHEANVLIKNEELARQYEDYFEDLWDGK